VSPVPVDDTLEKMEPALSDGRDEPRIDETTIPDRAHGPLTSLTWADEIPDLDVATPVAARPLSGAPAADKDWPHLPTMDTEHHSNTDLQPKLPPLWWRG
jgi:hypothetical protein